MCVDMFAELLTYKINKGDGIHFSRLPHLVRFRKMTFRGVLWSVKSLSTMPLAGFLSVVQNLFVKRKLKPPQNLLHPHCPHHSPQILAGSPSFPRSSWIMKPFLCWADFIRFFSSSGSLNACALRMWLVGSGAPGDPRRKRLKVARKFPLTLYQAVKRVQKTQAGTEKGGIKLGVWDWQTHTGKCRKRWWPVSGELMTKLRPWMCLRVELRRFLDTFGVGCMGVRREAEKAQEWILVVWLKKPGQRASTTWNKTGKGEVGVQIIGSLVSGILIFRCLFDIQGEMPNSPLEIGGFCLIKALYLDSCKHFNQFCFPKQI